MASTPNDPEFTLDISEQVARIDQMHGNIAQAQASVNRMIANTAKVRQDTRFGPLTLLFSGLGALAAFLRPASPSQKRS